MITNFKMSEPRNFIVFSDDWARHPSSCQHLFKRISKDHRVLWVNTIGLRAPKADRFTFVRGMEKICQWSDTPLRRVNENLWVLSPVMLPVWGQGILGRINTRLTTLAIRRALKKMNMKHPILWTTVPTAVDFVGKFDESSLIYYVTDDYSLWPGADAEEIRRADRELTQHADFVFACSEPLAASHQNKNEKTILLPHAVDFEHFSQRCPEPQELRSIPHPRACFFGLIYEKIDLDSLYELAVQEPKIQLLMIGPVKTNIDRLSALPNVRFLGPKPYEELPAYLQAMDLVVVPYVPDDEIKASGPLKIRECLALGKPTVARALPDLAAVADLIHLYDDRNQFVPTVRTILARNPNGEAIRMRDRVKMDTWESRVATIWNNLNQERNDSVDISNESPAWDDYLARHPSATIFNDPRWGQVMHRAYRNRPFYLTAKRSGQVVGILQLVEQKSLLFGSRLCSLPYFDSSGILADDQSATEKLMNEAQKLLYKRKTKWIELRQSQMFPEIPAVRTDKVDLRLKLPADADELWRNLDAKVRNQIRKAQSSNLEVNSGQLELLDDFYTVYVRNMRDLGSPPHSRRFFQLILESFHDSVRLFTVKSNNIPVAGGFTITNSTPKRHDREGVWKELTFLPWAASDWRAKSLCPNMLLYWSMLMESCARGINIFDFGRSTLGSGTWRFKKQWGAEESALYWHYLFPGDQQLPELRPDSAKYRFLTQCWRRLPVAMTRLAGPYIISRLS
ncbi:MAG: FemAB family XrtA/PEP-CTERM system-associated protein [Phycisphaerae bacterium]